MQLNANPCCIPCVNHVNFAFMLNMCVCVWSIHIFTLIVFQYDLWHTILAHTHTLWTIRFFVNGVCESATPTKRGEFEWRFHKSMSSVWKPIHTYTPTYAHAQCATWESDVEGERERERERVERRRNDMDRSVYKAVKRGEQPKQNRKIMTKNVWGFWRCRILSNVDQLNNQVVGEFRSQNMPNTLNLSVLFFVVVVVIEGHESKFVRWSHLKSSLSMKLNWIHTHGVAYDRRMKNILQYLIFNCIWLSFSILLFLFVK